MRFQLADTTYQDKLRPESTNAIFSSCHFEETGTQLMVRRTQSRGCSARKHTLAVVALQEIIGVFPQAVSFAETLKSKLRREFHKLDAFFDVHIIISCRVSPVSMRFAIACISHLQRRHDEEGSSMRG
jgi:hypothetical protein